MRNKMSLESIDTVDTLFRPLLPVNGEQLDSRHEAHFGRSDPLWRQSLIATLCFCPIGIISLFYSSEVHRRNRSGDFRGAYRAYLCAERLVRWTYGVSLVFYVILGILFLGLIEGGLLVGIGKAHTS